MSWYEALGDVMVAADPVAAWPGPGAQRLAARALLRQLLAEVVGPAAARSPIAARERGQPYLTARPEVGVSLSRSGAWVAAAVRRSGRVGVDVQVPVALDDRMVRRCCTPPARAAVRRLPADRAAAELAWIWSVQEACVKATGDGIAGRPWTVPVGVGQRTGRWNTVRWQMLRDAAWPVPVSVAAVSAERSR